MLTLQDASEKPVVVAVLAAMYGAKPMTELMSEQSQEHCWQLQVSVFGSAAADVLAARLASEGELSNAVTQHLMDLSWLEMPECQHPLLQQVLVSELGDLEACWRDSDVKDKLLSLPLLGMKLSSTSVQSQLVRLRVGLQLLKLFFSSGPAVMFKNAAAIVLYRA